MITLTFGTFWNINVLELWPIVVGLQEWATQLRGHTVSLLTDNTQVMFMLKNGVSSKFQQELHDMAEGDLLDMRYLQHPISAILYRHKGKRHR